MNKNQKSNRSVAAQADAEIAEAAHKWRLLQAKKLLEQSGFSIVDYDKNGEPLYKQTTGISISASRAPKTN
jgi:hypothetical protein